MTTPDRRCLVLGTLVGLFALAPGARAADPDPLALMKASDQRHRLRSERTEARMILQKQGGEPQSRELTTHALLDDQKGDRTRVRFSAPASVQGTALLTVEDPASDSTEQWMYLPAFRKTRRIGQSELGDRFVGSDVFFEDLQQREIEDYSYRLLRGEVLDGQDCWVIESTPAKPRVTKESPYGKSHLWMRKDNLFVVMVRFFDKRQRPLKELRAEDLKAVTEQAWRADRTTIVDTQRKHRTVLLVTRREVNVDVPEPLFTRHALERAD